MNSLVTDDREQVITLCEDALAKLKWDWQHPRLVDWLKRVMRIKHNMEFKSLESVPTDYLISLAKFLDLRYQCDSLLVKIQSDWSHPLVKMVEKKHKCFTQLPLKGYQELHRELEDLYHFEDMPF